MKNIISLICLLGTAAFVSQNALAEGGIKLRAGTSNNTYELNVTPSTGAGYTFASSSYSGTNFGVTFLTSDTGYIDIAASNGTGTYNRPLYVGNLTRSDLAFILGANLGSPGGSMGNLYIGWKTGETKLAPPSTAPNGSSNLDFSANGLVGGGGMIFTLGNAGAVGLNLGLGLMSGKYTQQNKGSAAATYKADYALGYSYGIGYSYPFTKNFGISADYKANSYNYVFDAGLTTESKLEEKFSSAVVSLFVKF